MDAPILLAAAAAVVLLVPLRELSGALPPVAFAAALVLFAAPGGLLCHWLLKDAVSGPALIPVGFVLSAGIFGVLAVPVLISHSSIETYLWAAGATLAAFLAAAAWRTFRQRDPNERPPPAEDGVPGSSSAGWLWTPFALLGAVLAVVATRRVPNRNDDFWVYVSWVRDFAHAERAALREPYFGERTAGLSRVHVDGWLLEQAALSRVSGLDPIELVLRYLTPTLVILTLLAVYALARTLLKNERAAVLCGSVYALFHVVFIEPSMHNVGVELAFRVSEDKHAARFLFLPIALLFAALFVQTRRWRHLFLFAFLCWTVVTVHPVVLADIGLCMLGFGLVHVAANLRRRRAWTAMVALALAMWSVALGPALLLFAGESPTAVLYSADINAMPPAVIENTVFITDYWQHIHEFDDGTYMMHPWMLLNPVILGTYLLGAPFLLRRARKSVAAQLLLGGLIVVTVVVYMPPVATFVGEEVVGPNLIYRLAWPIPLLILITSGWMLWETLGFVETRLGSLGVGSGPIRVLPLALVAALILGAAPPAVAKAVSLYREAEIARTSTYHPDPVYPWIRDNIEDPSVLLTRDSASTAIPAYSTSVDVVSYRSDAWIRDREALEQKAGERIFIPRRAQDVHDFFFVADLERGGYEILRRYEVDYLMVYADSPLDARLRTLPGFSPVRDAPRERFSLYAVDLRKVRG